MLRRGWTILLAGLTLGVASLASVGASAASAEAPEFGHCSVPVYLPYGSGEYEDSNCTQVGGSNPYDWYPETKGEFFVSKGKTDLETSAGTVACSSVLALGNFTSPKTIGELPFRFSGCALGSALCTSSGATAGEVRTSTLVATLGFGPVAGKHGAVEQKAAVQLTPPSSTPFAEFSCGATSIAMRGAPIALIVHSTKVRTLTLEFKLKKELPVVHELNDVSPEPLEASIDGGSFGTMRIKAKLKDLNYDDTLVNTVI